MPLRPAMPGNYIQRMIAAGPLAFFLALIMVFSWSSRDQLKSAIEASGAFVAAQFGQSKPTPAAKEVTLSPKNEPKVIVEVEDRGRMLKILDVPVPPDCHAQQHADYAGDAVVWGLGHKKASAAACCAACKEHQRKHPHDRPCNVWVWCGDPSGECWTMDIHNHTTGDCWLKHQASWDNNPDPAFSNLEINHFNKFSDEFRAVHKTAPEHVPWTAGVVPRDLEW